MPIIDEAAAWDILHRYAKDCLEIDSSTLLALYAIGSLAGGYYRPGQSDIDAMLIIENGSEHIWGNSEEPSRTLLELNRSYLDRYKIPKDFCPFPLQERELFPPYNPIVDTLALEIARLKLQGKPVHGQIDLDRVPMPTAGDFLDGAQRFEEWWQDELSKAIPSEAMSHAACVNYILMHLIRFLLIKKGIIEFNKRQVVRTYLDNGPPFVNARAFRLVQAFLESQACSKDDARFLGSYVGELRTKMNAYLGIVA